MEIQSSPWTTVLAQLESLVKQGISSPFSSDLWTQFGDELQAALPLVQDSTGEFQFDFQNTLLKDFNLFGPSPSLSAWNSLNNDLATLSNDPLPIPPSDNYETVMGTNSCQKLLSLLSTTPGDTDQINAIISILMDFAEPLGSAYTTMVQDIADTYQSYLNAPTDPSALYAVEGAVWRYGQYLV